MKKNWIDKFLFFNHLVLLNDMLGGFKLLNNYKQMVSAIKRLYLNCINCVLPCQFVN